MLWMGIWVHPYADGPLGMGGDFWKIGGMAELPSDVVRSWLMLQSVDCIHIHIHMYTSLMLMGLWRWERIFGKLGVWALS
jgi:hypothetical protein